MEIQRLVGGFCLAKLKKYQDRYVLDTIDLCGDDMQILHRDFQFQRVSVGVDLWGKLAQFINRKLTNNGIPDELTFVFGAFALYAAVRRVVFSKVGGKTLATITHIYVYAKDGFTFTDAKDGPSQYLGHWGLRHVAVVPLNVLMPRLATHRWVNSPVIDVNGDPGSILQPISNSDFRAWQLKHRQGGDYIIYTNKRSMSLRSPIVVFV